MTTIQFFFLSMNVSDYNLSIFNLILICVGEKIRYFYSFPTLHHPQHTIHFIYFFLSFRVDTTREKEAKRDRTKAN